VRGGPGRVTEKRGRERDLAPFYDRFTTTSCCHGHGGATVFFELHAGFSQMRIFLFFFLSFFLSFFFFFFTTTRCCKNVGDQEEEEEEKGP